MVDDEGKEKLIWIGRDPADTSVEGVPVAKIFLDPKGKSTSKLKIYLDTARVSGWNEIDAVELFGEDGSQQWAIAAEASSTYSQLELDFSAHEQIIDLLKQQSGENKE
jgi:hypothetical protein